MQYLLRFLIGGSVVCLFAALGDALKPKSFAGLFSAAPSLALGDSASYHSFGRKVVCGDRRSVDGSGRRGICSVLSAVQSADVSSQTPCGTHFSRRSIGVAEPLPGSLGDVFPVAHMIVSFHPSALKKTKWFEYAARFLFGGAASLLAMLLAKRFGPAFGGLFLAFPVIFPASATLIEKHEREKNRRRGLRLRRGDGRLRRSTR